MDNVVWKALAGVSLVVLVLVLVVLVLVACWRRRRPATPRKLFLYFLFFLLKPFIVPCQHHNSPSLSARHSFQGMVEHHTASLPC